MNVITNIYIRSKYIIQIYLLITLLLLLSCHIKKLKYNKIMKQTIDLHSFALKDWAELDKLCTKKECIFDSMHLKECDILMLGDSHLLPWLKIIIDLHLSIHPIIMVYYFINKVCNNKIDILDRILIKIYSMMFISHFLEKEL